MQYIQGSLKPGKAYKQRGLTHINCAILVDKQIRLYAEWMVDNWRKVLHVYPVKAKQGYAYWAMQELLKQQLPPSTRLIEVAKGDFL